MDDEQRREYVARFRRKVTVEQLVRPPPPPPPVLESLAFPASVPVAAAVATVPSEQTHTKRALTVDTEEANDDAAEDGASSATGRKRAPTNGATPRPKKPPYVRSPRSCDWDVFFAHADAFRAKEREQEAAFAAERDENMRVLQIKLGLTDRHGNEIVRGDSGSNDGATADGAGGDGAGGDGAGGDGDRGNGDGSARNVETGNAAIDELLADEAVQHKTMAARVAKDEAAEESDYFDTSRDVVASDDDDDDDDEATAPMDDTEDVADVRHQYAFRTTGKQRRDRAATSSAEAGGAGDGGSSGDEEDRRDVDDNESLSPSEKQRRRTANRRDRYRRTSHDASLRYLMRRRAERERALRENAAPAIAVTPTGIFTHEAMLAREAKQREAKRAAWQKRSEAMRAEADASVARLMARYAPRSVSPAAAAVVVATETGDGTATATTVSGAAGAEKETPKKTPRRRTGTEPRARTAARPRKNTSSHAPPPPQPPTAGDLATDPIVVVADEVAAAFGAVPDDTSRDAAERKPSPAVVAATGALQPQTDASAKKSRVRFRVGTDDAKTKTVGKRASDSRKRRATSGSVPSLTAAVDVAAAAAAESGLDQIAPPSTPAALDLPRPPAFGSPPPRRVELKLTKS